MAINETINQIRFADGSTFNLEGTQYTAGSGIDINNENYVISLASISGLTAGSYGPTGSLTPSFGESASAIPQITTDEHGRIISASQYTITIPSLPAGLGIDTGENGQGPISLANLPAASGEPWDLNSPAGPHGSTGAAMNKTTYEHGLDVHIPYISWDETGITDVEDKSHLINSLPVNGYGENYPQVGGTASAPYGIRLFYGFNEAPASGVPEASGGLRNAIYLQLEQ